MSAHSRGSQRSAKSRTPGSCRRRENGTPSGDAEDRFCQSLYYGDLAESDYGSPSLPLTNLAVEYFQSSTPRRLNEVNMETASSLAEDLWVSPCSMVTSMIYAKRLRRVRPDYLQKMSSSDLFFISVMMASKYMYDEGVDEEVFNDEWADAANMETDEVNQMERDFLSAMDWRLFVSHSEFSQAAEEVKRRIAWTQGCSRGWLSYTDLHILYNDQFKRCLWDTLALEWMKVVSVCSAAYIAGFLTMVGSTVLAVQASSALAGLAVTTPPSIEQPLVSKPDFDQARLLPNLSDLEPVVTMEEAPVISSIIEHLPRCNESLHDSTSPDEATMSSPFEKVVQQLWLITTLKEKLYKFVWGVSENIRHIPFWKKNHQKSSPISKCSHAAQSEQSTKFQHRDTICSNCPMEESSSGFASPLQNICPLTDMLKDLVKNLAINQNSNLKCEKEFVNSLNHNDLDKRHADTLYLLNYPTVARGFTTGVPIAA